MIFKIFILRKIKQERERETEQRDKEQRKEVYTKRDEKKKV